MMWTKSSMGEGHARVEEKHLQRRMETPTATFNLAENMDPAYDGRVA